MGSPDDHVTDVPVPSEVYEPRNIVVPLFGLSIGWAGKQYEVLPNVMLVPATEDTLKLFEENWQQQTTGVEVAALSAMGLQCKVGAFLVMPDFSDAQHLDPKGFWLDGMQPGPNQDGIFIETPGVMIWSLVSACENLIVTAFSLTHQADVRMPLTFKATVDFNADPIEFQNVKLLDESDTLNDYDMRCYVPVGGGDKNEEETPEELEALLSGLHKLWPLREWMCKVQQRRFQFEELEQKAKSRKGVHEAFLKRHGEQLHEGTRLARAIGLYNLGIRTEHPDHRFLSMCLALETLYTDSEKNDGISYKLAVRLAHVIGSTDPENRKAYFRRAKKVYNLRSSIVHGVGKKSDKAAETRGDAVSLAQESLCCILKNDRLRAVFMEVDEKKFTEQMLDIELT